ncbi:CBS domain-containing protein [Bacteroidales bacterium OttesenSCG-928-C19]|nr:CBS domain-containing protein [Bacteroidales bacterium OttesenSCG-928-C19]
MFIKDFISTIVPTLDGKKMFLFALTLMDELKLSSLPVVDEEKYNGLLTEDIIYEMDLFNQTINEYTHLLKSISLNQNQTIFDALNFFVQEKTDIIPIVDEENNYLGVLTKSVVLEALSTLIASEERGGILVLRMNCNDLHISEISKIIENEDANIINLFVNPMPASTEINVYIKINKLDLTRVERALMRYDYNVTLLSKNEEDSNESLSRKYELFMKYLSI